MPDSVSKAFHIAVFTSKVTSRKADKLLEAAAAQLSPHVAACSDARQAWRIHKLHNVQTTFHVHNLMFCGHEVAFTPSMSAL